MEIVENLFIRVIKTLLAILTNDRRNIEIEILKFI